MFINFWYVAARSDEVTDQPVATRMLGQDFVVFRDTAGVAHCLSGVCAHRGAALAEGRRKGDCIECPYHGWRFNGAGQCIRIPSQDADVRIPQRARVDSYPVCERYGLIFAFLGDLAEEERPPIMAVPEWGQNGWRPTSLSFRWEFDYKRSIENALDPSHNEFVHTTHLEKREEQPFAIPPLDLVEHAWGTGFRIEMPGPALHEEKMREVSGRTTPGVVRIDAGHHGVSSFWTYVQVNRFFRHQYFFETPLETGKTAIYMIDMRNAMLDAADDERTMKMDTLVMNQDGRVLLGLRPVVPPVTNVRENLMPSDRQMARYRERLKEWEARGWRIDVETVRRTRDNAAYAIPSPARRESRHWTLEPVPLIPARPGFAASAAGDGG